jgi:Zn-finger nucleic acid-binding protein
MRCLNCQAEMVNYDVTMKNAELSYNVCENCGSLWLDAGELDKMAFQVAGSIEFCSDKEDKTPETKKKCPRCDDCELDRVKFLGETDVILHHCRNCGGFWLDGGELNLIDRELARIMPVSGHGFSDFVNNTHLPFWYKRVRRPSSETDVEFNVAPIPGAKKEDATNKKCPADGAALDLYRLGHLKFEGCPKCHGLWLDKDELRKLKNKVNDGQLHWLNREVDHIEKASVITSSRPCPNCPASKLRSVIFGRSSVVIDWCPKCQGVWLDRDEFDSITACLRHEATRATPSELAREFRQDLKNALTGAGPESRATDLEDAAVTLEAWANAIVYENPLLFRLMTGAAGAGRGLEVD